jgi:hypothetical protein
MPSALITILLLYALLALAVASVLAPFVSVGFALWKHERLQAGKQRPRSEIPAKSAA